MSNYSTTIGTHGTVDNDSRPTVTGFWQRLYRALVAAREQQARREIERYYGTLSEAQLKDLGFPTSADRR